MRELSRRDVVKAGSYALGAAAASPALVWAAKAFAQETPWKPEKGASLRIMRWNRFVPAEGEAFMQFVDAFSKAHDVKIQVDNQNFEDLRAKAAVAANIGAGPDIVWSIHADNHLYPQALLDISDVAKHLGDAHGGWYPIAEDYGKTRGVWNALPVSISGALLCYRQSHVQKAGFEKIPSNMPDFLKLMQALKKNGTPGGFPLGNASGDGNTWGYWLLWAFGGKVVDENNNVVINSPQTIEALEYVKELYETFLPGTASWNDASNNKAFLSNECSLTANSISIYIAAKGQNMAEMAEDTQFSLFPIGPVGKPTEYQANLPMMIFNYTKAPQAAKAFLAFLMAAPQYNKLIQTGSAFLSATLKGYRDNPVWGENPRYAPFQDVSERSLPFSYSGPLGYAASSVMADFVVLNMLASAATGAKSPKDAAAEAQRRAERYYKV